MAAMESAREDMVMGHYADWRGGGHAAWPGSYGNGEDVEEH